MTTPERPADWPSPSEFIENARKHRVGLLGPQAQVVPYTGVSGFMSDKDVRAVAADAYTVSGFGTPIYDGRRLAIGVRVSWDTLNGRTAGQPGRYPMIGDVRAILDAAAETYGHRAPWQPKTEGTDFDLKARCMRTIHYDSREPNLFAQVDRLLEIAGPNLDGVQLDMDWPREDEIRSLSQDYPMLRFILRIGSTMYSSVSRSPQLLATEIAKKYSPWITDVMFDMSGGAGKPADLGEASQAIEALYSALGGAAAGGVGVGLAGGLHWQNVASLAPIFGRWPDLSIDAEGGLRDKDDALDTERAREYVRRACGVMPLRTRETRTTP